MCIAVAVAVAVGVGVAVAVVVAVAVAVGVGVAVAAAVAVGVGVEVGPQGHKDRKTPNSLAKALKEKSQVKDSREWKAIEGALAILKETDNSMQMVAEMRERANVVKRYSFSARPYL